MIKLLRIDDRLIHGQVAFVWVNTLKADLIVVANDKYATNAMLKMTLNIGKPSGIDLLVETVDNVLEFLASDKAEKRNIFLVVDSTKDAAKIVLGIKDRNLNLPFEVCIGGIRPSSVTESKLVATQVYLSKEDLVSLDEIQENGRKVYAQDVPTNKKESYSNIRKNY